MGGRIAVSETLHNDCTTCFDACSLNRHADFATAGLQELMLHETAVSWVRDRLKKTLPRRCWEETEEAYGARLKEAASYINSTHDVEGLCMEFPGRLRDLVEQNGDRLAK